MEHDLITKFSKSFVNKSVFVSFYWKIECVKYDNYQAHRACYTFSLNLHIFVLQKNIFFFYVKQACLVYLASQFLEVKFRFQEKKLVEMFQSRRWIFILLNKQQNVYSCFCLHLFPKITLQQGANLGQFSSFFCKQTFAKQ